MKTQTISILILSVVTFCNSSAQDQKEVKFRTNVSHDDLVKVQKRQLASGGDPIHGVTPISKEEFKEIEAPGNLLDRSDFITANGLVTLVPKRAIIHIPEAYKGNLNSSAEAKLVSWSDFLVANRAWIETYEVTRHQAEGKNKIEAEQWESFSESKKMVVATLLGGPISVLPLQVAKASTLTAEEQ